MHSETWFGTIVPAKFDLESFIRVPGFLCTSQVSHPYAKPLFERSAAIEIMAAMQYHDLRWSGSSIVQIDGAGFECARFVPIMRHGLTLWPLGSGLWPWTVRP